MIDDRLLKPYNPKETEDRIYKYWMDENIFNPDVCITKGIAKQDAPHFSIVLPPPNVTGTLHTGHSIMLAIQDIMVRYERMRGKRTLWIPGTDHAAIATQSKVEEIIYKTESKTRHDLGRDEFLRRVNEFASQSQDTILAQIKKMGASVDWSRQAYTLDEKRSVAVREAFTRMYKDGLIYQGERIVNWDPKLQTTVSDDEIEYKEEKTNFYYLKYGPFIIGTSRPETKFGDKYIVMHPDDKRYSQFKNGQKIDVEWITGKVTATIVKDEAIDMTFGTGVMTITPAHDFIDFEIAERHKLDYEQIIDFNGKLLPVAGELAGQHIKKARPLIIDILKSKNLVEKIDDQYIHRVATNSRGGGTIEPQIKKQWFVAVNKKFVIKDSKIVGVKSGQEVTLKELMRQTVESKHIKILPEHFEKTYYHWIDNLRDWCISRQLWFGHRIPVWYKQNAQNKAEIYVGVEAPKEPGWEQDSDTLDTWFSSGLWTFSTLGWPLSTDDFTNYHPTSVLETGYDILFFWVARMILMSTYLIRDIPFKKVYLHGLVRDEKGRKMSKSLGNIVDPVTYIDKYGADALRMALIIGTSPGSDSKLSEDKVRGYKNFANKIWNATRFVLTTIEDMDKAKKPKLSEDDQKLIVEFEKVREDIVKDMNNLAFYLAGEKIYHYFWHTFADIIIEESKEKIAKSDSAAASSKWLLFFLLQEQLKILHPFMPFVTEELWSIIFPTRAKPLAVELL